MKYLHVNWQNTSHRHRCVFACKCFHNLKVQLCAPQIYASCFHFFKRCFFAPQSYFCRLRIFFFFLATPWSPSHLLKFCCLPLNERDLSLRPKCMEQAFLACWGGVQPSARGLLVMTHGKDPDPAPLTNRALPLRHAESGSEGVGEGVFFEKKKEGEGSVRMV